MIFISDLVILVPQLILFQLAAKALLMNKSDHSVAAYGSAGCPSLPLHHSSDPEESAAPLQEVEVPELVGGSLLPSG